MVSVFIGSMPENLDDLFRDLESNLDGSLNDCLDLPTTVLNDMNQLEEDSAPQRTLQQTKKYSERFRSFLRSKNLPSNFEEIPDRYLSQYLRYFYSELRQENGEFFSPSSLICIRAGIHRRLTSAPINRNVDILHGEHFAAANNMLRVMVGRALTKKKMTGEVSQGICAIEKEDLRLLRAYFDRSNPTCLQDEVFFNICYHFGFRGREWIRDLKKDDVCVCVDAQGREFVDLRRRSLSKNVKASLQSHIYEDRKCIVMYSLGGNTAHCPVVSIKDYLSRIPPKNNDLFPKAVKKFENHKIWYCDKGVLGKNTLATMMKSVSLRAKLSKAYTNHCVRATVVTELKENNVPIEDIQLVTGHKRPGSVDRYVKRISDEKKKRLSDILAVSLKSSKCCNAMPADNVNVRLSGLHLYLCDWCMFPLIR
jgi:integrase